MSTTRTTAAAWMALVTPVLILGLAACASTPANTGLGSGGNDRALVPVESKEDQSEEDQSEEDQSEFSYDDWKDEQRQPEFGYEDWERRTQVERTIESLFLAMTEDELALRCAEASTHKGDFAWGWEQQAIEDGKEEWAAYGDYAEALVLQRCTEAGY